jgi:hypothetical protein
MKRLKAIALKIGRVLAPLLLTAVIVLWVRSFLCTEEVRFRFHTKSRVSLLYLASMPGSLGILFDSSEISFRAWRFGVRYECHRRNFGALYCVPENTSSPWNAMGFAYKQELGGVTDLIGLNAPHWFAVIVLAGGVFLTWRRRRRPPMESRPCPACGYSLIGNESGICPECGGPAGQNMKNVAVSSSIDYAAANHRRRIGWRRLIPLLVLTFLLVCAAGYAIIHWHDLNAWDL